MIWPKIDTTLTPDEGRKLHELARDRTVLELGALNGASTVCMAQSARLVVSVDWHQGDTHSGFQWSLIPYVKNLVQYGVFEKTVPTVGRFEDVLPLLADDRFELIFLDGHHAIDSVRRDITAALPKLTLPGVLAFHDYGVDHNSVVGGRFDVKRAVDERFRVSETVDTLAVCNVNGRVNRRRDAREISVPA